MGGMSSYNLCLEMPNRFAGVIFFAPAIKHMAAGVLVSMAKLIGKKTTFICIIGFHKSNNEYLFLFFTFFLLISLQLDFMAPRWNFIK